MLTKNEIMPKFKTKAYYQMTDKEFEDMISDMTGQFYHIDKKDEVGIFTLDWDNEEPDKHKQDAVQRVNAWLAGQLPGKNATVEELLIYMYESNMLEAGLYEIVEEEPEEEEEEELEDATFDIYIEDDEDDEDDDDDWWTDDDDSDDYWTYTSPPLPF